MKEFNLEGYDMNSYWHAVYYFMEEHNCNKATAMLGVEMAYDKFVDMQEGKVKNNDNNR